jgi:hypothetical protein
MILKRIIKKIAKIIFRRFKLRLRRRKLEKKLAVINGQLSFKITSYYSRNSNDILVKLCDQYGSDKGSEQNLNPYPWDSHSYADFYSRHFASCRNNIKKVFECGIGTNNPNIPSNMTVNGIPGASLRVWRDYFPNADIFGGDIDAEILFEEDRIKTFYLDQLNPNAIKIFWDTVGITDFDLMIDDGLHTFDAGLTLFIHSICHLSSDGVYVIEDVQNKDLFKYKTFFEHSNYNVDFILLDRPTLDLADNNLVVIRK